jgi:hypothetical protein
MEDTDNNVTGIFIDSNNGSTVWHKNYVVHRDNGLPAVEYINGDKEWYKDGKPYRENNLPVIEKSDGTKFWWINNRFVGNYLGKRNNLDLIAWGGSLILIIASAYCFIKKLL